MSLASTQASVLGSSTLTLDLPSSDASLDLFAAVTFYKVAAGTPTVTTPTGWTLIDTENVDTSQCQVALFWKVGDGTTSVSFVFSAGCHATAGCVVLPGRASAPYEIAAVAFRSSTSLFSSNSLTTTLPNETLLGVWAGFPLTPPFSPVNMEQDASAGGNPSSAPPLLIADDFQAVAGASGTRSASTIANGSGTVFLLGWKPDNRPTVPSVVYAAGGESLTSGATVALSCTAASSPSVATSALQYEFSYSLDNGGTWTALTLSPTGVTSKTFTVPATLGNTNLIRVRAYDGSLYSPVYGVGAAFNIVAETTPTVNVTSPSAGSIQAKSASQTISWSYSGGPGNPQTQFTLQWATNSAFTSPTNVGPTSSAVQSTTIDTTGVTDGATVYVRVKAQGVSLYSAYSSAVAFVVASAPATPNITAPINASPPTSALPTVTFTESSAFVARKFRVVQASVEVYNSGTVIANVTSFLSPYAFANGVAVTIYLSMQNSYGLWSAEDSETVTPSYSGPTAPTVVYAPNNDGGYIAAKITNSGSLSYNELWKRISGVAKSLAYKIATLLPNNAQFEDHDVISGTQYVYFVRTYNGSVFTDSADSSAQSVTLAQLFLHVTSRTSLTSNALSPVKLLNLQSGGGHDYLEDVSDTALLGRDDPGALFGQSIWESVPISTFIKYSEQAVFDSLIAIFELQRANGPVCYVRNNLLDGFYARVSELQITEDVEGRYVSFTATEASYNPAL